MAAYIMRLYSAHSPRAIDNRFSHCAAFHCTKAIYAIAIVVRSAPKSMQSASPPPLQLVPNANRCCCASACPDRLFPIPASTSTLPSLSTMRWTDRANRFLSTRFTFYFHMCAAAVLRPPAQQSQSTNYSPWVNVDHPVIQNSVVYRWSVAPLL